MIVSLLLMQIARWEVILFVGGMAAIIVLRLLTRQINSRGLLLGTRKDGTTYFSPERVQALLAMLAIGMRYLMSAAHSDAGKMPDMPTGAVELLAASNAIYLAGKGWMMLRGATNTRQERVP